MNSKRKLIYSTYLTVGYVGGKLKQFCHCEKSLSGAPLYPPGTVPEEDQDKCEDRLIDTTPSGSGGPLYYTGIEMEDKKDKQ